ncbi:Multiple EGF-like-domain protein 3 precursor [Labilithrix luteola]|uniref:Multiple EGF-like-domain protein 3 n=1 Tax=Labilithrix luteola TaxID=1391654 RepID=A0A0K1Q5F8_9BACT|nr:DUF4215 domain-containing protein [Labilithrix luteola]AKV00968.1 Multiple EGF-like-domain protein 3 precursor [Labilithrix luteola]
MNFRGLSVAAIGVIALIVGTQGCGTAAGTTAETAEARICTPNANVFCRCDNRAKGTKRCNEDGTAFAECTTGGGQCKEDTTDPNAGAPVDTDGNIIEGKDAGETGPAIDTCPGQPTAVGTTEVVIQGDTSDAKDDTKGDGACNAGAGGPDHIYHLQPTGSGPLSVKVEAEAPFNPTIYLRTDCTDESAASQVRCGPPSKAGATVSFTLNVASGKDYYLVVDGASGSQGKYKLTLKLTTGTFCGDGRVDSGEACDDGNHDDNDGCSPDCQKPNGNPPSGNGCPGHPVDVWSGKTVTGTGSNKGYGNQWKQTGNDCTVSSPGFNVGQEHVYEVTAHAAGTMLVTVTPATSINLMLVARKICTDPNSQPANTSSVSWCSNDGVAGEGEQLKFPVTNGEKVYVAVDGAGTVNNSGDYTLSFKVQ